VTSDRFARLRMKGLIGWPIVALVVLVVAGIAPPRSTTPTMVTASAYAFYLALLAAALRSTRRANLSAAEVFGPLPTERRPWTLAAGLAPLLLMFSATAVVATLSFADVFAPEWTAAQMNDRDESDFLARLGQPHSALLVLIVAVIAPIVEEYVFRGMLMRRWIAKRGFWTGVLGSAALFAVLHPPAWIGSFLFGVVAGVLYLWSGSLLLPILVHILNNAMVTVFVSLSRDAKPPAPNEALIGKGDYGEWTIFAVMLVIVGAAIASIVRPLIREIRSPAAPSS
jgi:membrane protease YdiL (CAAX protease family)